MPVIDNDPIFLCCDEQWDPRPGTAADVTGDHEYTRTFLVGVKVKEVSSYHVCQCPLLPRLGTFYTHPNGIKYDPISVCVRRSARHTVADDWGWWTVTVEYSTKVPEGGLADGLLRKRDGTIVISPEQVELMQTQPWLQPAAYKFSNEVFHEAPPHDLNQKPYVNSAGMPFTPPPTFEVVCPTLTLTKNVRNWTLDQSEYFAYSLNDRMFLGRAPGTAQCMPPVVDQQDRGALRYYRATFTVRFRPVEEISYEVTLHNPADSTSTTSTTTTGTSTTVPLGGRIVTVSPPPPSNLPPVLKFRTWQPRIVDAGMMERVVNEEFDPNQEEGPNNRPYIYLDIFGDTGRPVSSPVLLNGKGRQQHKRDSLGNLIPEFVDFYQYKYKDLSLILLNQ